MAFCLIPNGTIPYTNPSSSILKILLERADGGVAAAYTEVGTNFISLKLGTIKRV
jgi:hypothetical protein